MTLEQLREELGPAAYDDLVEGVRCQAESDVALLIEAIDRNNGSVRRTTPNPTAKSQPSPTPLVLAMVAALRVQRWYEEGHLQSFANGPPDPASLIPIVERSAKGTLNEADAVAAKRFAVFGACILDEALQLESQKITRRRRCSSTAPNAGLSVGCTGRIPFRAQQIGLAAGGR
jgi:hypothetical protein